MYDCEICGKKTPTLYIIDVEGAEMATCQDCSAGKSVMDTIEPASAEVKKHGGQNAARAEETQEELVEDFGEAIRKARETLGIPLITLAEMINEKESMLKRVEQGRLQPTDALTRKLEKQLGIKLTVTTTNSKQGEKKSGDGPITLGDAAFKK